MNLKKITKVLSKIRKNTREHGDITTEDEDILRELLGTELSGFFEGQNDNAPTNPMPALKQADNDNSELSRDQKYRLRLAEQSNATSMAVH